VAVTNPDVRFSSPTDFGGSAHHVRNVPKADAGCFLMLRNASPLRCIVLMMTPRRAFAVGIFVTFVFGFILAGYNGTALYVWYTTGQVEILGRLESRSSFPPILYGKALFQDALGCLLGICLLIAAAAEIVILIKSFRKHKQV
jgi:hypothetical protein